MSAEADPRQNLRKALGKTEEAVARGARIICLQELFHTPYFCQREDVRHFRLALEVSSEDLARFEHLARQRKVVLIVPFFEKRSRGIYHNSACVIDADGRRLGIYRKMHIPDDPLYHEKFYFTPGDTGFRSFQTRYAKLGVLICWDQWFPEAARMTALAGAEIIFYPSAIGSRRGEPARTVAADCRVWELVQRAHAATNQVFVATVNRVGRERGLCFWGQSFVAGPSGELLGRASANREQNLIVDCDLDQIDRRRQEWPFFRDRRVDAYGGLVQHDTYVS